MNRAGNGLGAIAIALVIFLAVVAVAVWLLDLVAQQSVFGILVGAEFFAFAMLVYLYYEENAESVNRKRLSVGFAVLAALVVVGAAMLLGVGASPKPNVELTLYAGEVSSSVYGFGLNASSIQSPGPVLTFKVGDVVKMTVMNVGQMPHNWALTAQNQTGSEVLFNAQVGTITNPLFTNQGGKDTFTIAQTGNFYYICEIPGHVELGMWGTVVVNP